MRATSLVFAALSLGIITPAWSQQSSALPNSGSFKIHSGFKGIVETMQVGDKHFYTSGNFWGVTYNDAGVGPLHMGAVVCPFAGETIDGAGTAQGTCAWSDADGEKIFVTYTGRISPSGTFDGLNKTTGGTGKFDGIQGLAPFQCKFLNDKNQATCTQQFDYHIGLAASTSAQQVDQNTRQEIEMFVARFAEHYNKQDAAFLASEFTKDAVRVAPGATAVGPQAIEEIFKTQFKVGFNHIDLTVDQVSPLGTDAVITLGKHHVIGQGQSGPLTADGLWSEVEVREGGAWKIRALTIVPNPPPQSPAPSGTNR